MSYTFGEPVTRQRGTATEDVYSDEDDDIDWEDPDEETTAGWGVDDSKSAEPLDDARNAVVTDFVLYRDEPADILPGDRVVVRGLTCNVAGRPATWKNPWTGWEAGFVVRANIWEG